MKIVFKESANKFDRCETIIEAIKANIVWEKRAIFMPMWVILFGTGIMVLTILGKAFQYGMTIPAHHYPVMWVLAFGSAVYLFQAFKRIPLTQRLGTIHIQALGEVDPEILKHAQLNFGYPLEHPLELRVAHLERLELGCKELAERRLLAEPNGQQVAIEKT